MGNWKKTSNQLEGTRIGVLDLARTGKKQRIIELFTNSCLDLGIGSKINAAGGFVKDNDSASAKQSTGLFALHQL